MVGRRGPAGHPGPRRLPHAPGVRRRPVGRVGATAGGRDLRGDRRRRRRHPVDGAGHSRRDRRRAARRRRGAGGDAGRGRRDDDRGQVRLRTRPRHRAADAAGGPAHPRARARRRASRRSSAPTPCRPSSTATPTATSPSCATRCCRPSPPRDSPTRSTGSASRSRSPPSRSTACFTTATRLGLRVKVHADQFTDGGGATLAAAHGALSADHLEHASPDGIAALAASGTVAVLLPGAAYVLGDETVPPVDCAASGRCADGGSDRLQPGDLAAAVAAAGHAPGLHALRADGRRGVRRCHRARGAGTRARRRRRRAGTRRAGRPRRVGRRDTGPARLLARCAIRCTPSSTADSPCGERRRDRSSDRADRPSGAAGGRPAAVARGGARRRCAAPDRRPRRHHARRRRRRPRRDPGRRAGPGVCHRGPARTTPATRTSP